MAYVGFPLCTWRICLGLEKPLPSAVTDWPAEAWVTCAHCSKTCRVAELPFGCDREQLPATLSARFVQLKRDAECDSFLCACLSASTLGRLWKDTAAGFLRKRLSLTDANALTGRGTMFVLSTAQARQLLDAGHQRSGGVLLDVGAGDGAVTAKLAPLFDAVLATEASVPMQRLLRQRGFAAFGGQTLDGLEAAADDAGIELGPGGTVDCVALLNVLDRCSKPLALLETLRGRLRPGRGRLLLAVVLPFRPFVEVGAEKLRPLEALPLPPNATWERSVSLLWEAVLQPMGFELEALARLPYISDGDLSTPVYALDEAMFVLRRSLDGGPG